MNAWRRLRARMRYRRFDDELRRELDVHRAMAEDALRARQVAADDVRRQAARQIGNVTLAREASRAFWIAPWLESLWQDVRFAARAMRRQPGFAITTIGTLTLGIGLNTAFFTAFNAHFLQPWPVADPDRVALVSHRSSGSSESRAFSRAEAEYLVERSTSFSHLVVVAAGPWATRIGAAPASENPEVFVSVVASGFFDVLGRGMATGRGFRPDDERPGAPRVAVISYGTWHRRFGGDPDVVGRTLYVDGEPFTVVGVAARGVHVPMPHQHEAWILPTSSDSLRNRPVTLVGRLAPGVDRPAAAAELTTLHAQVRASTDAGETRGVDVTSTSAASFSDGSRLLGFGLIQVALAAVLILACLNVANMQLARALSRRAEIALRLSLGADRGRIVRQLVTEAALLAGLAAIGAFAAVCLAIRAIHHYMTPELIQQPFTPDTTVLVFTGGVGLLCTLVFGLVPALQSTKALRPSLAMTSTGERTRMRFRSLLLASQIALSALLIVAASLLTRGLVHASASDPDFDLDGVAIGRVTVPSGWSAGATGSFRAGLKAALERSSLWPVGFVDYEPLERVQFVTRVRTSDRSDNDARTVRVHAVSTAGLEVLRLHLLSGRAYDDVSGSQEVVVNQTLARRFWPSGDAVGQALVDGDRTYTIVGVVRDARFASFESTRPIEPTLYRPPAAHALTMIVRGPIGDVRDELGPLVQAIDPRVTVATAPLRDNVNRALADEMLAARVAWGLGGLGLTLAVVGVFGMFGYMVEARRREIGIRLALGASRRQVLASVFATMRWATAGGLGAGLLLSVAGGALLRGQMAGLNPLDPIAYGLALAILLAAALAATFIPAQRATRVDPATTLRTE